MTKRNLNDSEYNNYFNNPNNRNKGSGSGGKKKTKNKKLFWGILGSVLLLLIAFTIFIFSGLPSLEELENPSPQLASKVFTEDGELLGQFFIENRIETTIDSLPDYLIEALIATEDRKFYDHWGVDLSRFLQAMVKNIFTFSREGASTITQQLSKNLYNLKVRNENMFDTGVRKIREWITAIQIEKQFTKDEILEMYLNVSYFGRSAYGIESAARIYFDKKANEITLLEAALFVALLKSPEAYDPIRQPENAMRRRNLVMYNMVVTDKLSQDRYNELKMMPIEVSTEKIGRIQSDAPHFMEYIRQQLAAISDKYGYDLYRDGLNIYTTLDYRMQKTANKAAADHIKEYQEIFNKNWNWDKHQSLLTGMIDRAIKNSSQYKMAVSQDDKSAVYNRLKFNTHFIDSVKKVESTVQVGFVVIDPTNGHIKAMVGGENQNFGRGLNHVTGIKRQPGSAFKPIIYTTAIDNGYYPAYTLLNQKFNYKGWSPSNADNNYGGFMTLRRALAFSVNVIAGRLTIGEIAPPNQVVKYARRLGIKSQLEAYPSIALGTSLVSPLELTSAFGTLANNGVHVEPIAVLRIEDKNGILIDEFIPEYSEAISPQTATIMQNMMSDVVNYGTGGGVRRYFHRPAAGKTGTTQNFSDAWFIGYTPQLVGGVWVGFDDHRVKFTNWYGQGAKAALPIWGKFMEQIYQKIDMPLKYFELADGIESVTFCRETMDLGDPRVASEFCTNTVTDIVNKKHIPPKCELHTGRGRVTPEDRRGDSGW